MTVARDRASVLLVRPLALTVFAASVCATTLASTGTHAATQPRHATRKSQPVPTARAAPDVTGTIAPAPPRADAATAKPSADEEALPAPFNLPAAPRARMRVCGEQWQEIKMSGRASDDTWREFATKCLAEKSASSKVAR